MIDLTSPGLEEVKRLIEAEMNAAAFIPLRRALSPHLIEPFVRLLKWPYSNPEVQMPCWVIADLGNHRPGLMLAYSQYGHGGGGNCWGVMLADDTWIGRDDSWFSHLEDAFINSGAWKQPLPPGYEVR